MSESTSRVIIIGAGVAGVAAAVSAARHNAKVILVERGECAGGLGSAGLVPSFTPFSYKSTPIIGGFAGELYRRLLQNHGSDLASWPTIDAEMMKLACDDFLLEAGVEVRYLTDFLGAETRDRHIVNVRLSDRGGQYTLSADNFIDATGDAALAHSAGVEIKCGDETGRVQACSCCFVLAGIRVEEIPPENFERNESQTSVYLTGSLRNYARQWLGTGEIKNTDTFEYAIAGANLDLTSGIARLNFGHFYEMGCCDTEKLSQMLMEGRRHIHTFVQCMKKHIPGMEHAVVVGTPALPDVRESRRIVGRTVLSGEAFWTGQHHPDDIALYDYYIDVHALSLEDSLRYARDGENIHQKLVDFAIKNDYGIPFGITLPKEYDNLGVAGRCVSATRDMLGALRVMPASMATGQAIGTAAALSVPLADVSLEELRHTLRHDGVILEYPINSSCEK